MYRDRSNSLLSVVWLLVFVTASGYAEPVMFDDVGYVNVTVSVGDPDGNAFPGASVYGYCGQYGLMWPRFAHDQYNSPWESPPRAVSAEDGFVHAQVPKGRWSFVAVGSLAAAETTPFTLVCAARERAHVKQDMTVTLSPTRAQEIAPTHTDMGDVELTDVFCEHPASGVWLSIPLENEPTPPWRFAYGPRLRTMLALRARDGSACYVTALALPATGPAVVKAFRRSSLARIALVRGSASVKPVRLRWAKDIPGFKGSLEIQDAEAVYLYPGEYLLSYDCELDDGTVLTFGPGLFSLKAGETLDFVFGDGYRAGMQEQRTASEKFIGMLMVVDAQGLFSWRWTGSDGKRLSMKGELVISSGESLPVECKYDKRHYWNHFQVPKDRVPQAAEAKSREWRLDTPLKALIGDRFQGSARTRLETPYFHIDAIEPAAVAVQHFLTQADRRAQAVQEVCGHAKKRNTLLRLEPQLAASATHNGSRLSLSIHRLQFASPTQNHAFVHELTHNFGYRHGPLMELIVELARDNGGPQLTAQLAKWIFFDRMNGRKTPETVRGRWRDSGRDAPLGLYFYLYNQNKSRGRAFIVFLSKHTRHTLIQAGKRGIPARTARVALTSAAMRRDLRALWEAYGYDRVDGKEYDAAMDVVRAHVAER